MVYAALWRAVNVSGRNMAPSAALREILVELGYERPQTLLNSGNAVFSAELNAREIEDQLEWATKEKLGLATSCFVRSAAELATLRDENPFPNWAEKEPNRLMVAFAKTPVPPQKPEIQRALAPGRELIEAASSGLYLVYSDGVADSKATNGYLEKRLGVPFTMRNWNTLQRLLRACEA